MNGMIDNELLDLLACPECRNPLGRGESTLLCPACGIDYTIEDGIPLLYPKDIDREHIAEEETLGELMKNPDPSPKELFHEEQWKVSKEEYWSLVRDWTGEREGLRILNAGCGIDTGFFTLDRRNMLVAFDLMPSLLASLREEQGSRHNVAGAVQSLPFREGSFDCVCCVDLIHHETDRIENIIDLFHEVLKPGGVLFLEDINAWGIYQFWKSILLPRPLHRGLRDLYHTIRGSGHRPARYEFPTSVFRVRRLLERAGFTGIEAVPQKAYPNVGPAAFRIYRVLSRHGRLGKYHNFHYLLQARK